jgi:type IV pilus assembly protein PilV
MFSGGGNAMKPNRPGPGSGFTLIELTVATAIFSMGVGSFSLLLLLALQGTMEAQMRGVAIAQSESLAEMILMTSDAAGHFVDPPENELTSCFSGGYCDPSSMAGSAMRYWERQVEQQLPDGEGTVCRDSTPEDGSPDNAECDGGGELVVKVFWETPARRGSASPEVQRLVAPLPQP